MPGANQTSPERRWRSMCKAAERLVQHDDELSRHEKQLVLEYVRTALEAIRAKPSLFKSIRAGVMGPHAMATTLTLLVMLSTGEPLEERT